jgi:hypothetical protein
LNVPIETNEAVTLPVCKNLSLRLYRSNQPCCLETSALQKGLVLVYNGRELIEEGIGFGVPVIKYRDKTLFSSSAEIQASAQTPFTVEKRFLMDTVSKKRFFKAYVNDGLYDFVHKVFEKAYLGHNRLYTVNNKLMELREVLRIKTEFLRVKSRGAITVKYALIENIVQVTVDFTDMEPDGCLELLMLNEQGAKNFQRYIDTDGLRLNRREIGAWDMVHAKRATLSSADGGLGFSLETIGAAGLFRGWECTKNRFAWAGLSYSIKPKTEFFYYKITLTA